MTTILYGIAALSSLVCAIMVLVQLFKTKGALHGILGILSCLLYPFIWGWINGKALNLTKIMLVWTISLVVSWILGGAMAMSQFPALQKQIEEAAKAQQGTATPAPAPAPVK